MQSPHISEAPEPVQRAAAEGFTYEFRDKRVAVTPLGLQVVDASSRALRRIRDQLSVVAREHQFAVEGPYYRDQMALLVLVPREYFSAGNGQLQLERTDESPATRLERMQASIAKAARALRRVAGVEEYEDIEPGCDKHESAPTVPADDNTERKPKLLVIELADTQGDLELQPGELGPPLELPPGGLTRPDRPKPPQQPHEVSGRVTSVNHVERRIQLDEKYFVNVEETPTKDWEGQTLTVPVSPSFTRFSMRAYQANGPVQLIMQGDLIDDEDMGEAA